MLFTNWKKIVENGQSPFFKHKRNDVLTILQSAIHAMNPYDVTKKLFIDDRIYLGKKNIKISDYKRIFLIGFGKASVGMAQAVCDSIAITKGAIITQDPNSFVKNQFTSTMIGTHPIPSQRNINATEKLIEITKNCEKDDLLIVLISGGGSSLLCKPRIPLKDLKRTTELLLRCGADIKEINTVRKHLSLVKGGQLVKKVKCQIISLIISDVIDDPIEFIASGPTAPDSTTYKDAKNILFNYHLWEKIPGTGKRVITNGILNKRLETPKTDHPIFREIINYIIANNTVICRAAEKKAKELGYETQILTTTLTGEAREVGKTLIQYIRSKNIKEKNKTYIAGGETTVTLKGNGRGGRNQEIVLGALQELDRKKFVFASFSTDGIDGNSDAAGAIADGCTLKRAREKKLDQYLFLKENNSYEFFKKLNDLLITDSTGTNVMDILIILH